MSINVKVGIFGGSFDPVHYGHLWIAEAAKETLGLDRVIWLPAATSPLKPDGPVASDDDRIMMLRLALSGSAIDMVDDREIRRGGVSYTVETLAELATELHGDQLFLLMGSDSLASIGSWREPAKLCQQAVFAVIQRGGDSPLDFRVLEPYASPEQIAVIKSSVVTMPQIELSSSQMRFRIRAGKSVRYQTPRPVESLISAKKIYQSSES